MLLSIGCGSQVIKGKESRIFKEQQCKNVSKENVYIYFIGVKILLLCFFRIVELTIVIKFYSASH